MTDPKQIIDFASELLVPAVIESLKTFYDAYMNGEDIGVESKSDDTPASRADRETEKIMRDLITETFPDHGIIGEEFDALNPEAEFVWILDPLDGTREFLGKKPGCFGSLMALLRDGLPVFGVVVDPLYEKVWSSDRVSDEHVSFDVIEVSDAVFACTNPQGMFKDDGHLAVMTGFVKNSSEFRTELNCIGFVQLVEGNVDVAVENDLALHDVAALIPVLLNAGMSVIDLHGNDYNDAAFELPLAASQKFSIIAARDEALAWAVYDQLKMAKAA